MSSPPGPPLRPNTVQQGASDAGQATPAVRASILRDEPRARLGPPNTIVGGRLFAPAADLMSVDAGTQAFDLGVAGQGPFSPHPQQHQQQQQALLPQQPFPPPPQQHHQPFAPPHHHQPFSPHQQPFTPQHQAFPQQPHFPPTPHPHQQVFPMPWPGAQPGGYNPILPPPMQDTSDSLLFQADFDLETFLASASNAARQAPEYNQRRGLPRRSPQKLVVAEGQVPTAQDLYELELDTTSYGPGGNLRVQLTTTPGQAPLKHLRATVQFEYLNDKSEAFSLYASKPATFFNRTATLKVTKRPKPSDEPRPSRKGFMKLPTNPGLIRAHRVCLWSLQTGPATLLHVHEDVRFPVSQAAPPAPASSSHDMPQDAVQAVAMTAVPAAQQTSTPALGPDTDLAVPVTLKYPNGALEDALGKVAEKSRQLDALVQLNGLAYGCLDLHLTVPASWTEEQIRNHWDAVVRELGSQLQDEEYSVVFTPETATSRKFVPLRDFKVPARVGSIPVAVFFNERETNITRATLDLQDTLAASGWQEGDVVVTDVLLVDVELRPRVAQLELVLSEEVPLAQLQGLLHHLRASCDHGLVLGSFQDEAWRTEYGITGVDITELHSFFQRKRISRLAEPSVARMRADVLRSHDHAATRDGDAAGATPGLLTPGTAPGTAGRIRTVLVPAPAPAPAVPDELRPSAGLWGPLTKGASDSDIHPAALPLTVALPGGQQGYFKVHPRRYLRHPDGRVALLEEPKPLHDGSTVVDLVLAVSTAHNWQWGALLHIAGSPDPLPASAGLWDLLIGGASAFEIRPVALPLTVKLPGGRYGTFPVYQRAPVQQAPGPLHDESIVADLILLVSTDKGIAHNWEWGALLHVADKPDDPLPNSAKLWGLLTTQGQSAFGIRPAPAPTVPDELRTLTLSALAAHTDTTTTTTATVRVLLVGVNTSEGKSVEAETVDVTEAIQDQSDDVRVRVKRNPSFAVLGDTLAAFNPHAVHIMCHGTRTELKFPGSPAGVQHVAGDLSAALQRAPSCRLVVLNACNTATIASRVLEAGAATVVVSTTQLVLDEAASSFAVRVWGLLAEEEPIGVAFEDAIRQLPIAWRVVYQLGVPPAPPPPPSPPPGELHERLLRHSAQQRANDGQWQLCRPFLVAPVVRDRLEETADHTALFPLWEASVLAHAALVAAQKHDPLATSTPLPTKGFALYGSPGSGKSTCLLRFEELVWERFDAATHPVLPVRLLLSQVATNDADPVKSHLIEVGYSEAEVEELKRHHAFVILLDGFDEMKRGQHLMTEQLVRYGGSIVVSGRLQSLREFQLFHGGDGLDERYLCGLDGAQIAGYMRKRQETAPALTDTTIAATLANPALMGITTTPLMLFMLVDVLLEPGSGDDQLELVQRFDLYERFTKRWFDREFRKLVAQGQLAHLQTSDALLDVGDALSTFAERIALLMFQRNTLQISGEEQRAEERAVLAAILDPDSKATLRLRQVCPLKTLDGRVYEFVHKSFMEFLVARQLLHSGGGDRAGVEALLGGGRRIQEEPQILLFLLEAWTSEKHARSVEQLRKHLFAIVPDSATNPELAAASANAATWLNWMQESLSGMAWAGVRLQGADLAHSVMAGSDLRGADLRGVRFKEAALYGADVSEARMAGVEFGELPPLDCGELVRCIAMSSNGVAACGLKNGDILLWDVERQEKIGRLAGHCGLVWGVAFSNDGRRLVSGCEDGTVRVWDVAERRAIGEPMRGHDGTVNSVAFHPNGRLVASGSDDATIRFWDAERQVADGEPLTGHSRLVWSLAFSPDGTLLASGSADKTVRLWDVERRSAVGGVLAGHIDEVRCVAFSPDGRWLASGSVDSTIRTWDVARREAVGQPLRGHISRVKNLAFSPDSRRLASGSNGAIRVWDVERQQPIGEPLVGHGSCVNGVAFTPDGRRVASVSCDKTLRVWEVEGREAVGQPLLGHRSAVFAIAFSPDGERLASGSSDATVLLCSVERQEPAGKLLSGPCDNVKCVAFHPDGRHIASGCDDKTIRIWDVERQEPVGQPLKGHGCCVRALAFSPDGRLLASGSCDHTVRLWSVETQQQVGEPLKGHTDTVRSVAFSPDEQCIASGSDDKTIRLWSAERHEAIGKPLQGHDSAVCTVAFSPDGRLLASGSWDATIRLWNVEQQSAVGSPAKGHSNTVRSVAFSSDGRLVSGSRDRTVRVWGFGQDRELRPLVVIPWCSSVNAVAYSSASFARIAIGDSQGSVAFFEETAENTWTWTPPQRCSSRGLNATLLKHNNCIGLDPTVARLLDQAG